MAEPTDAPSGRAMRLWRLTPTAAPDDPSWLGAPIWEEVLVAAATSGAARFNAARWEAEQLGFKPQRDIAGNVTMDYPSALADERLYHLEEAGAAAPGTADTVVAATGGLFSDDPRMRGLPTRDAG